MTRWENPLEISIVKRGRKIYLFLNVDEYKFSTRFSFVNNIAARTIERRVIFQYS